MLANLLAETHQAMVTEVKDHFPSWFNSSDLPEDATAQFAAGILYGESEGGIDQRDYIVGCSSHHDNLDSMLEDVFTDYEA